jgi:hypothetical protein
MFIQILRHNNSCNIFRIKDLKRTINSIYHLLGGISPSARKSLVHVVVFHQLLLIIHVNEVWSKKMITLLEWYFTYLYRLEILVDHKTMNHY